MAPVTPFSSITRGWNRFFFCDRDPTICSVIRIAYATLLLINVLVWLPDLELWFSEAGVMPYAASRTVIDPDTLTLLGWLPKTTSVLWTCYAILLLQIVLLLVGFFSRLQAVCVFVWLVSFQHRNILLFDGEDTVFRLFCFFLIFVPSGYAYSIDAWRRRKHQNRNPPVPWGLRLFQIQMSIIYLSTGLAKASGTDWINGTALYYISRLDDLFGRFWLPSFIFESLTLIKILTWSVIALELTLPFALWCKRLRRPALALALLFHLITDYSMNLFLFQWIMIVGLLSFTKPEDWNLPRQLAVRLGIARRASQRVCDTESRQIRLSTRLQFQSAIQIRDRARLLASTNSA